MPYPKLDEIHANAVAIAGNLAGAQADLVDAIQEVEEHRVFLKRGYSSVFRYMVDDLGMDESATYGLITIARKAREVPELKECLRSRAMTFSNARRVVSVLTRENKKEWIKKASELSSRQLEKEIAKVRPREATIERATYVTGDRVKLEVGLSERTMLSLRRAQDLLSQSKMRAVNLEETIGVVVSEFVRRHDPVEKAKRHRVRNTAPLKKAGGLKIPREGQKLTESVDKLVTPREQLSRVPIPRPVIHEVYMRDQGRCTHVKSDGSRCNQSRWIEIHHKVPVSEGGTNVPENLITLCSAHHKFWHLPDG